MVMDGLEKRLIPCAAMASAFLSIFPRSARLSSSSFPMRLTFNRAPKTFILSL